MGYQKVEIQEALKICTAAERRAREQQHRRYEAWLQEWVDEQNAKWWRRLLRLRPLGIIDAERRFKTAGTDDPRVGNHEMWSIYAIRHMGADIREACQRVRDTVEIHNLLNLKDFIFVRCADLEVLA